MNKQNVITLVLIALTIITSSCSKQTSKQTTPFNEGWSFTYENQEFQATVPGCIHTDLMKHNIIEDPFYRDNEKDVQWISDRNWIYKKTFDKNDIPEAKNVQLVFVGLDTYANIYINGELIKQNNSDEYSAFNMFREWRYDLPDNLKEKDNEIVIEFFNSTEIDKEKTAELGYVLPEERAFTRKAPYQSGWDWGPRLITCGMWKQVYFEGWNDLKINTFQVQTEAIDDDKATLKFLLDLKTNNAKNKSVIDVFINNKKVKSKKIKHNEINPQIDFNIEIDNPKLWWPNGMGEQNLYDIKVKVKNGQSVDIAEHKIGIRQIELVTDKDEIGSKFEFHINGIPTFMKGANYIPSESFPINRSRESHYKLIEDCKNANFNMLRIWGGGIYEDDAFYDACDEMGILIWQDFMFACALYPGDKDFLENVGIEAEEQIVRLRNHPCIALWCGNNEVKNGWDDWGWKNDYTSEQRNEIDKSYHDLFLTVIPNAIEKHDPTTPYHHTSPLWGWGHPECCTEGDSHYWGVWWGELPFEMWKEKTGRFMSEYGFQSYPEFNSIKQFTIEEDWDINSPVMKNHQKHGRGIDIITNYMKRYFGVPDDLNNARKDAQSCVSTDMNDFEEYLYRSQLLQAYGIGNAIETHRIRMPHCMGTLYWQINDCWPVASWSSTDYFGNKKALYYTSKQLFEDIILAGEMQNDTLVAYLVSDLQNDIQGKLTIQVFDFNGKELRKDAVNEIIARKNTSTIACFYPIRRDFKAKADELFVKLTYESEDKSILLSKIHYLVYPKELKLSKPDIISDIKKEGEKYTINIKTNVLTKGVYISASEKGEFSDNYFDMLPNSHKIVTFTPEKNDVEPMFDIKTYFNAF